MSLVVVVADSYHTYTTWCIDNNIPPRDRRKAIPLTKPSDTYRLLGRDLTGARFVKLGNIRSEYMNAFKNAIKAERKHGSGNHSTDNSTE